MNDRVQLLITLDDDALFPQSSATEGGLRTLDYIPGATLLGAAAARCYDQCADAWNLFHSGAVRFGDGIPLHADGLLAWPAPLTWQRPKEGEITDAAGRIKAGLQLANASAGQVARGIQRKPLRDTCVTADGHLLSVPRRVGLKTAIEPGSGRVATGQLFQYESLRAGSRFVTTLAWDGGAEHLARQAIDALCGKSVALGRSRSAEYGMATARPLAMVDTLDWPRLSADEEVTEVALWCLSDLCLLDRTAQPCLCPSPEDLGLPAGDLLSGRSYIQTRNYSPFNAKRRAYDVERQVIVRGSVLAYRFDAPQTIGKLDGLLARGAGLHREAGLGWISVDHAWQRQALFDIDCEQVFLPLRKVETELQAVALPRAQNEQAFISWVRARAGASAGETERREWAQEMHKAVQEILRSARDLAPHAANPIFPSATQWARVASLAKEAAGVSELLDKLIASSGGPLFGAQDPRQNAVPETQSGSRERDKAGAGKNAEWFAPAFLLVESEGSRRLRATKLGDWLVHLVSQASQWPDATARIAALANLARTTELTREEGRAGQHREGA